MGSSGAEAESGGIDETVGGLVWVRRRNGSWWPGQIISVDQLPKSHSMAVNTGTPVKLLGRDDASIDWYNFTKSKRVKTFRCGEFDDCIEKAKAAVSAKKKSVKYARREDAIICALEIENSYELRDNDDSTVNTSVMKLNGNLSTNSLVADDSKNNEDDQSAPLKKRKVARALSHLCLLSAETGVASSANPLSMRVKRRKTPNDSEDDGIIGIKRMRGIKDLVFDISSKIKDEGDGGSDQVNNEITNNGNGISLVKKRYSSLVKKKRSAVVYGNGHDFKRRKDRRRTLTRVLEESVMVSVPVIYNELSGIVGSPRVAVSEREAAAKPVNSDDFPSNSVNNCVDGIDVQSKNVALSCLDVPCNPSCSNHKPKEIGDPACLLPLDGGAVADLYDVHLSMDDDNAGFTHTISMGISGKVKIECTSLCQPSKQVNYVPVTRPATVREGISNDLLHRSSAWQSKGKRNLRRTSNHKTQVLKRIEGVLNKGISCQSLGLKQLGGFSESLDIKNGSKQNEFTVDPEDRSLILGSHKQLIDGLEDEAKGPTRSLPYRYSRLLVPSKYEEADFPKKNHRPEQEDEQCLHDVHTEVKAAHRSNHVPIVSFMSKFNGKAIIGHPLTVEITENGYSDKLFKHSTYNAKHKLDEEMGAKKQVKSSNGSKKGLLRNGKDSKKTKRLSALSGFQKSRKDDLNPVVEKAMSPASACIPLNVVFRRLNEAINGSKQHHFRTLSK